MHEQPGAGAVAGPRRILHVDMDAFYASVEEREDPRLRGLPVVVGGAADGRGVVAAASYAARRFGVTSAMPAAQARRLCPQAVFITPRHALYASVSRDIHAVLAGFTPQVEPLALDEAFLDVTGSERLLGPALDIARQIKQRILAETRLVASVGVAPNKFLAKLACAVGKPDALLELPPGTEQAFLDPLPVTCLWGLGRRGAETLGRVGVRSIADLREQDPELLNALFGRHGAQLWALAHGRDERPVLSAREARSVSHETTFERDIGDAASVRLWLLELADQVAARARHMGVVGRTVTIKLRFADFRTITRSSTLPRPTSLTRALREAVEHLLAERLGVAPAPVRLLGVALSGLQGEAQAREGLQADLFDDPIRRQDARIDELVDSVRARFGSTALRRARRAGRDGADGA